MRHVTTSSAQDDRHGEPGQAHRPIPSTPHEHIWSEVTRQPSHAIWLIVACRSGRSADSQRALCWLRRTGTRESLPYRGAGILLLLYAQPLVRVASLRTSDITMNGDHVSISLGKDPAAVPAPFAQLLLEHLGNRPNLQTGAGAHSEWLFPSTRAGQHLHPGTLMNRIHDLGIDLLGACNRAIADLVTEVPPALVADALGYSHRVAFKHAAAAGEPWARYAGGPR